MTPKAKGQKPRFTPPQRPYVPFAPPAPGEPEQITVRRHLDWLLANLDWFAVQGRAALNGASVAMHRDLALLAGKAPTQELEQSATELARLQAEQIAKLESRIGSMKMVARQLVETISDFYYAESKEEKGSCYQRANQSISRIQVM